VGASAGGSNRPLIARESDPLRLLLQNPHASSCTVPESLLVPTVLSHPRATGTSDTTLTWYLASHTAWASMNRLMECRVVISRAAQLRCREAFPFYLRR
jgi:hypothetical protein